MARAKGFGYYSKKGSARRNDNTPVHQQARGSVRILSTQDATAVGRPGFGGYIPGPHDGKTSIRRLMVNDPAKGITQPGADVITDNKVDLVGALNPKIVGGTSNTQFPAGKKTVKTPRKSPPVKR